jgi:hypothetical protein
MFPFGFVLGAAVGAMTTAVLGHEVLKHARPVAKAILKATMAAMHEVQVHSAEIAEVAEDLYAEAKAEVTAEAFAAAMAAQAKAAAEPAAKKKSRPAGSGTMASAAATRKAARKRTDVRRSRKLSPENG